MSIGNDLRTAQVAVIDPTNDADVKRLVRLLAEARLLGLDYEEALRDALTRHAAGEGLTPPPLTVEPTDLAERVIDKSGTVWARVGDKWVTTAYFPQVWEHLRDERSPLRLAEPTPDPWASYYDRDLTDADLDALPVGSRVRDCDDDEATKSANGKWVYGEWTRVAALAAPYCTPFRLVSVGGEGK